MKGTILILAALVLAGCSDQTDSVSTPGKPVIFVSIPPQAGLVKAIAGDAFDVRVLVGEGQSPHAYEPTARQLSALGDAKALFTIGVPFEKSLLKKIGPLYPELPIIETDEKIKKRSMPHAHHGEHCSHDHGETDPHVWLDPRQLDEILWKICEGLMQADPENAQQYRIAAEKMALHGLVQMDARLEKHKGARFYVFHPSFGYFADAYGLIQVPIELDGKAPSPRQLADLIEQAQVDGVKVIFVQKQFPADSANAVAKAIGGAVVHLDPLAEDVVANLQQIADALVSSYNK
ncbi:zinc ABC transporter substrate-binding protein [Pontiellaceae bacterium B12227]|nr:zinc ABC transporter substrate-binding protein [Pontiellaceae bacterium B12227]